MKDFIRLTTIAVEKNRLVYEFETSLNLFIAHRFVIDYDAGPGAPDSILSIPFAGLMSPIAWATGADLHLPELDARYLQSIAFCEEYFKPWFTGRWPFDGRLVTSIVSHPPSGISKSVSGALFSGGVDSLSTYAALKPERLFMVFGADIPLSKTNFVEKCRRMYSDFAAKEGTSLDFIRTNIREVLDKKAMKRFSANWYSEAAHGIWLTSLLAPVTWHRPHNIAIANCSHPAGSKYVCGSHADVMENIGWAETGVKSYDGNMSRVQKIQSHLKGRPELLKYLRVCWSQFENTNCSSCEKCLRTICELLLNNIDPNACGFPIDQTTLSRLKSRMTLTFPLFFRSQSVLDFWRNIQASIRLDDIENRYGSRAFFAWLSSFDALTRPQNPVQKYCVSKLLEVKELLRQ